MCDAARRADYIVEDRGHDTPCWIWQKALGARGHGVVFRGGFSGCAHRWYYMQHVGPVPAGAVLDHLCRVRACVNPAHLEPVTQAENVRRSPLAKLTDADVAEIRRLIAQGLTQTDIGSRFGVSRTTIGDIKRGRRWATPGGVVHA